MQHVHNQHQPKLIFETKDCTVKKKGVLPNFEGLALFYETILSFVAWKTFRNFHTKPF